QNRRPGAQYQRVLKSLDVESSGQGLREVAHGEPTGLGDTRQKKRQERQDDENPEGHRGDRHRDMLASNGPLGGQGRGLRGAAPPNGPVELTRAGAPSRSFPAGPQMYTPFIWGSGYRVPAAAPGGMTSSMRRRSSASSRM